MSRNKKMYMVLVSGQTPDAVYTTLKGACAAHNIPYRGAIAGNRAWHRPDPNNSGRTVLIELFEMKISSTTRKRKK